MKFIVRRPFNVGGRRYEVGDEIKAGVFKPGKAEQLVEQRTLRSTATFVPMVVTKAFGKFKIGDKFPLKGMRADKVAQLLEHRFIQPQATSA